MNKCGAGACVTISARYAAKRSNIEAHDLEVKIRHVQHRRLCERTPIVHLHTYAVVLMYRHAYVMETNHLSIKDDI